MYCTNCNTESGPTLFCHVCDRYLPTPLTGLKAGLVRRVVAVIVDQVLALTILILSIRWLISTTGAVSGPQLVIVLVSCFALVAYSIAFCSSLSQGATPGKWILGIRAIDKRNGEAPGLGRMLVREIIGKFVSGLFFGLGFFWAIWDRDSQAWHDKLAGTVVVRRDTVSSTDQQSTMWPAAACIAFLAVFVLQVVSIVDPAWSETTKKQGYPQIAEPNQSEFRSPNLAAQPSANTISDNADSTTPAVEPVAPSANSTDDPQEMLLESQIKEVLTRFASATEANDPSAAASFYGESVDRYFLSRNITKSDVLQDKEASWTKGLRFNSYRIEQVNFDEVSSSSARVSLVKSYEFTDPDKAPVTKRIHSRLWLQNTDAGWKIVGEQDLLK
ncbi:RDD family protein [Tunturiibacter lichenicola]|uniref:RDD family protein n=1 Tax=Tunturiibacter lichenicola TaxID=2051959 RepID=UPI003D9BC0D9